MKEENFAKISSLRQLQPLVDGQQWGIFCIEFDSNKFEVSALRKILSKFVPKRRSMIDHAVWEQQDLLFICNWGEDNNSTIGIAHFEDQEKGLPQIKMISCAPALEDFTQIKVFEDRLAQLAWPKNTSNIDAWREAWSNAFASGYRQTGGGREDPVIHFYEEFLTAYDKSQKVQRGVYYTPQPVVNFIVRAVDSILKTEFGYADGLASTDTKKIKVMRESKRRVNGYITKVEEQIDVPAVQILDPATGTGTFLRQTILQIYENFQQKHKGEPKDTVAALWNKYVDESLLPRLNGFELMMAPYAVAHMKLAMVLKDTGYDFSGEHRLNVFLTNTLEQAGNSDNQLTLFDDPLALESVEANRAKKNTGINIVMGNPPYSGISSNSGEWIASLIEDYKYINGVHFGERKHWLQDDYVKFIRYSELVSAGSGQGILAFINNHAFIDNPTFRCMRYHLLESYDEIYILDLHGNVMRRETAQDGGKDENVFDIQQGVSINIFIKRGTKTKGKLAKVFHAEILGRRDDKYNYLANNCFEDIRWQELQPNEPFYFFIPRNETNRESYEKGFSIEELMPEHTTGVVTARDGLVISPDRDALLQRIEVFCAKDKSDDEVRDIFFGNKKAGKYLPGDSRGWSLAAARKK